MTAVSDKKSWEKERRDRLKVAFTNLEKLLPSYDPSSVSTRINVLTKSIEYIQEMQNKIQELLKPNSKINAEVLQLKKLQDRIKRLVSRNELLSTLLREAKIPIPNQGSTLKNFKYVYKWSGKINEKTASILQKRAERIKENEKENKDLVGQSKTQKKTRSKSNSCSWVPKHRKTIVNRVTSKNDGQTKKKSLQSATTNCLIINTQPCYLVTNAPSTNFRSTSQTVITNSLIASNPLMSTNIKSNKKSVINAAPKLPSLGAGTLILANGTLYPVLPPSQPIFPTPMVLQVTNNSNTMLLKSQVPENQKIINDVASTSKMASKTIVKNISSSNALSINSSVKTTFSSLNENTSISTSMNSNVSVSLNSTQQKQVVPSKTIPIRPSRCPTKTTQVNKVPIPALTSSYSTSILTSKSPLTKRNVIRGKRIGDRPMSRVAFRKIRKAAQKEQMEKKKGTSKEMETNNSAEGLEEDKDKKNHALSEKDFSNAKSTEQNPILEEQNILIEMKFEQLEKIPENNLASDQKNEENAIKKQNISIISNDIIQSEKTNKCDNFSSDSSKEYSAENSSQIVGNEPDDSFKNVEKVLSPITSTVDNFGAKSYSTNNLLNSQLSQNNQVTLQASPSNNANSEQSLGQIMHASGKVTASNSQNEPPPDSIKNDESLKNDAENLIETNQNINHNSKPANHIDTDNICNMNPMKNLELHLGHSELSNDIFASLQVPAGCQNPESTSPTAAFLLAFPLVSSLTGVKVTEVMDDENPDSQRETPTLLQIGTMDTAKSTQSGSLTPNLLNLDNLSFFSSKDICSGFYSSFEQHLNNLTVPTSNNFVNDVTKITEKSNTISEVSKIDKEVPKDSNIGKTQPSDSSKNNSVSQHITQSENGIFNVDNRGLSSNINCQSNTSFQKKSGNSVSNHNTQNNKSIEVSTEKVTDSDAKDAIRSTPVQNNSLSQINNFCTDDKVLANPQKPINQNVFSTENEAIQTNAQKKIGHSVCFNEISVQKNSEQNIFCSFNMKRGSSDSFGIQRSNTGNIFSMDNGCSQVKIQKNLDSHFVTENQNMVTHKNLDHQINNREISNMQKNIQGSQVPFVDNRNFIPISSQTNFAHNLFNVDNNISSFPQKNMKYKHPNFNQETIPLQKNISQPYFNIENNFQNTAAQKANTKNIHGDNRNNETLQKNTNYNHFTAETKNIASLPIQKSSDINFTFNLDTKGLQKAPDTKQMIPNYGPTYTNMNYDLNAVTKVCTCTYISNKTFPDPLYTNSNNNNYNYYSNSDNYLNENFYKNSKTERNSVSIEFENYDYRKADIGNTYYPDNGFQKSIASSKPDNVQEKPTYNWMTTPTKSSVDNIITNFSKEDAIYSVHNIVSNSQTAYFNTTSIYTGDINTNLNQTQKKSLDLPLVNMGTNYPKNDIEENQFTWSPTKMPQFLEPVPNFVSSTLPTLVGDLALGTSNFTDQKLELTGRCNIKETKNKATKFNYENQNNFFSVSQLVHQNKEVVPAKPTRRRNSGSGSKNNQPKSKKASKPNEEQKEIQQYFNKSPGSQSNVKTENKNSNCRQSNNTFCESNKRNNVKVSSTNYSAEALIGHQGHSEATLKRDQLYSGSMKNMTVPPFIPDNIIPYFPPVDLQQDNYIQQNQNYQNFSHNFTTFSNNTYSTNTFIPTCTTPYLNTSTFMTDLGNGHDFATDNMNLFPNSGINKDSKYKVKSNAGGKEEKIASNNQCASITAKKIKKKPTHDNITPNFVDFSFLSVPGNINSPLLPDDFHSHASFLHPPPTQTQLYPCKNPLYPPKQNNITSTTALLPIPSIPAATRTGIQHPEVSPSLNSAGTSLTNFNLSTIFPEINKGSMSDIYSDNRVKDPPVTRHYPNNCISFNTKTTFTYPNCQTTQSYGIDNR